MLQRLVLFLAPALVTACANPQPAPAEARPQGEARVLFIGNSYTYINSLPDVVEAFARALSPDLKISTDSVLVGGATLRSHWGTLAFFLEERGLSPAPIELTFTPVAGGALAGRIRVTFAQADPLDATIDPRLDREELSFSVANFGLSSTIEVRAVLRDDELHGVANAVEGPRARWHGSWRARRAVEATSRSP